MSFQNQIYREWKYNKEGIVNGAIVGVIVATYIWQSGMPLNFFEVSKGYLFDRMFTLAPQTKDIVVLYLTSIVFCSAIGYVLDRIIHPRR